MVITDIIGWAIFGLVAGAIARLLHPGRDPMNWVYTMGLGILGAVIGGYIGGMLGLDTNGGLAKWIAAIAGAIALLAIFNLTTGRRTAAVEGPTTTATNDDYKKAVFDDLSRGPNG